MIMMMMVVVVMMVMEDDDGDAANGDKPEVSPKECIDRQAGTFAQDIPASHVYCRLKTKRKYSVL